FSPLLSFSFLFPYSLFLLSSLTLSFFSLPPTFPSFSFHLPPFIFLPCFSPSYLFPPFFISVHCSSFLFLSLPHPLSLLHSYLSLLPPSLSLLPPSLSLLPPSLSRPSLSLPLSLSFLS